MRIKETRLYLGTGGMCDGATESRVRDLDKGEKMPADDPPFLRVETVDDAAPLTDWQKDAPAKAGGGA